MAISQVITAPRIFKAASAIQIAGCIALIAHFHYLKTNEVFDSFFLHYIQLAAALLQHLPSRMIRVQKTYILFVYLAISILSGFAAAILFLLAYNLVELDCIHNGNCNVDMSSIIRCGMFLFTEVLVIHPTVSYIIFLWNEEGGGKKDMTHAGNGNPSIHQNVVQTVALDSEEK